MNTLKITNWGIISSIDAEIIQIIINLISDKNSFLSKKINIYFEILTSNKNLKKYHKLINYETISITEIQNTVKFEHKNNLFDFSLFIQNNEELVKLFKLYFDFIEKVKFIFNELIDIQNISSFEADLYLRKSDYSNKENLEQFKIAMSITTKNKISNEEVFQNLKEFPSFKLNEFWISKRFVRDIQSNEKTLIVLSIVKNSRNEFIFDLKDISIDFLKKIKRFEISGNLVKFETEKSKLIETYSNLLLENQDLFLKIAELTNSKILKFFSNINWIETDNQFEIFKMILNKYINIYRGVV